MSMRAWIACVVGVTASALLWTACLESTRDVACPSGTISYEHACYPPDAKLPDGAIDGGGGPDLGRECSKDGDCKDSSKARCNAQGQCVACIPDTQPEQESTDCEKLDPTRPICTAVGTCHACASHAQCTSQICIFDGADAGRCASANEVAYVDDRDLAPTVCDTGHPTPDGSSTNPYCDVTEALSASTPWKYIRVAGSSAPYSAISLADRSVTIIGPGRDASSPAQLVSLSKSSVSVSVSASTPSTVVLDGLSLSEANSIHPAYGLNCNNPTGTSSNANVILRNSLVELADNAGVVSTGCALTLDANLITTNAGGGVSVNGGRYLIQNNLIVKNGNSGPGVALSGTLDAGSVFWFNTVAGNTLSGGGYGGINCGVSVAIQASIIWANTQSAGSSVNNCTVTYSDVDQVLGGAGNLNQDPTFVDTTTYRIKSPSVCMNQIVATTFPGQTLPDHDVDGHVRPRPNMGWDIGANQAQ